MSARLLGGKHKCLCYSGKDYALCCGPYHEGEPAPNALKLMRSRYCAYAMKLAGYLMDTTHPNNSQYMADKKAWEKQILFFCSQTTFTGLKIKDFQDGEKEAFVTFTAILKQGGRDASFTEKSRFEKLHDRWLYLDAALDN